VENLMIEVVMIWSLNDRGSDDLVIKW